MKRLSWVNLVFGVWLFFSPFVLPYFLTSHEKQIVFYQHFILGFLIAAFAIWHAIGKSEISRLGEVSLVLAVLGILTVISPIALKISDATAVSLLWNDAIVGIVVTSLALYNAVHYEPFVFPTHHPQH